MKENLDFVIDETSKCKMVFRFYPEKSSYNYNKGDLSLKSKEIEKIYYYKILMIYKDGHIQEVFDSSHDENSVIDEVALFCNLLSKGQKEIIKTTFSQTNVIKLLGTELYPLNDGVSWLIRRTFSDKFCIFLFRWDNVGYRFYLKNERMKEFADYLNNCDEYMIKNKEKQDVKECQNA